MGSTPTQCLNTYMGSTLRDITQVMNEKEGGILMLIGQVQPTAHIVHHYETVTCPL